MQKKNIILLFVVAAIVGAIWYFNSHKTDVRGTSVGVVEVTDASEATTTAATPRVKTSLQTLANTDKSKNYPRAKEITTPDGFINTPGNLPITISQYVGKKVILIDFWTYSCINCQRTTPYLNTWYSKYESQGFVIIGIHTPEFEFEKNYDNVSKAVAKENIKFPVVLDNDFSTWTAYQNQYWPRKYLIDMAGYVVYDHIGEGGYEETEKKIQELLMQRKDILGDTAQIDTSISKPQGVVTSIQSQSPETYFGSARNEFLYNENNQKAGGKSGIQTFAFPGDPDLWGPNLLYLSGTWNIQNQYIQSQGDSGILYHFNAKEVYFVAGADSPTDIEILLDGKPVTAKGKDVVNVNGKTVVHVKDTTLYHLIDLPQAEEHILEIRTKAGLKAFTFTFG